MNLVQLHTENQISYCQEPKIDSKRLDIVVKKRSSKLPWRGQFSPELIEYLLETFAKKGDCVLDPFVGSGTVLFEALQKGISSIGIDVNPAAYLMSSVAGFSSLPEATKIHLIKQIKEIISDINNKYPTENHLFNENNNSNSFQNHLLEIIHSSAKDYNLYLSLAISLMLGMGNNKNITPLILQKGVKQLLNLIDKLTETQGKHQVHLADARYMPISEEQVDLVITSPPYINVFNYHQNYRPAIEFMGWHPLTAAKSEIGANRKHRQNRFLTVIQYCMDMQLSFLEMARVLKHNGKIVLVIGKSSSVLGTSFFNADLLERVLIEGCGLSMVSRNSRIFMNRFGESIGEEVIVVQKKNHITLDASDSIGKEIGVDALKVALINAQSSAKESISDAIENSVKVMSSPKFSLSVPNYLLDIFGQNAGSKS